MWGSYALCKCWCVYLHIPLKVTKVWDSIFMESQRRVTWLPTSHSITISVWNPHEQLSVSCMYVGHPSVVCLFQWLCILTTSDICTLHCRMHAGNCAIPEQKNAKQNDWLWLGGLLNIKTFYKKAACWHRFYSMYSAFMTSVVSSRYIFPSIVASVEHVYKFGSEQTSISHFMI